MKYDFQSASHIDDYLKAIEGSEEFIVKHDAETGIIVINYLFTTPVSFPDPMELTGEARRLAVLRRDCRGLKFDLETGDVVAKPYHKFFNVNQKPETQVGVIDWSQPHIILEKLDGSMITPFRHRDGSFQWHTKMGPTQVAGPVYAAASEAHKALSDAMIEDSQTAIFEWCSRVQRIVIDYPVDQLVLTAVRNNRTGIYLSYPELVDLARRFGVPVVMAWEGTVENAQRFLDDTAEIEGAEGVVIRFNGGHMCKVKGMWYCRIHSTKETIGSEKNVWGLILSDTVDDAMGFMDDKDRAIIEDFTVEFERRVRLKAISMMSFVNAAKKELGGDKKRFAMEVTPMCHGREQKILGRIWAGQDPVETIKRFLVRHSGSQAAIEDVRDLVGGLNWKHFYYAPVQIDDD